MEESSTYQYIVSKGVAKGKVQGEKRSCCARPGSRLALLIRRRQRLLKLSLTSSGLNSWASGYWTCQVGKNCWQPSDLKTLDPCSSSQRATELFRGVNAMEESSTYQYILSKGVAVALSRDRRSHSFCRPPSLWSPRCRDRKNH